MATPVQELRTQLHRLGYDTRVEGGHNLVFVYNKDGSMVRTRSGKPITFSGTPSDPRAIKNAVAMLRDQGVLPRQAGTKAQTRRDKVKLSKVQLKRYSAALREEVLKLMSEHGLRQVDIYTYANYYAQQHGIPKPNNPQGVVSKLLKHDTALSRTSYEWLSKAVSAIKASDGKIPKAEELRKQATILPSEPRAIEPEGEPRPAQVTMPKLAFDVMQMIYREDKDPDAVMQLVLDVAKLETGGA